MHRLLSPALLGALLTAPLAACEVTPATYDYGVDLESVTLVPVATDEGVHPSTAALTDPNNPFADSGVGVETKWELLDAGYWPATFYGWATLTAEQPNGEHQFYTAQAAQQVYERRDCAPEDLYYVWQIAIGGYQAVLDHFPNDVTYDATGEFAYPLAPTAYAGIVSLGGTPEGWTLVTGEDGTQTVVPVATAPEEAE